MSGGERRKIEVAGAEVDDGCGRSFLFASTGAVLLAWDLTPRGKPRGMGRGRGEG